MIQIFKRSERNQQIINIQKQQYFLLYLMFIANLFWFACFILNLVSWWFEEAFINLSFFAFWSMIYFIGVYLFKQ